MSYFYADGADKNGNRLITSYGKRAQAEKYRAGAKITEGEKLMTIDEDGSARMSAKEGDLLVRTLMLRPAGSTVEMGGKFVVYAKMNGKWEKTDFRYKTYAAANSAVKSALINLYEGCAVVEEEEHRLNTGKPVAMEVDEDAPF